jgi:hypothetical protein
VGAAQDEDEQGARGQGMLLTFREAMWHTRDAFQ